MRCLILILCLFLISFRANGEDSVVYALPKPKSVLINGTLLHYIDTGQPTQNSSSKPVLFVHGSLGDYRTWKAQIGAISKDRRVLAYSRRYHYPNPFPDNTSRGYSASVHAEDLAALIEVLGITELDLVGHSFGAFTALLVARDHSDHIDTLTIAEPPAAPIISGRAEGREILKKHVRAVVIPAARLFADGKDEEGIRLFVNGVRGDDSGYDRLSSDVKSLMMDNVLELKGQLAESAVLPGFGCIDARNIDIPVLVVDGEDSPTFFRQIVRKLNECLPNETHVTIPQASHGLVYENPSAFNNSLNSFLNKHK